MSGHIYFCLCAASNAVKIGHSTRVKRRVKIVDAVSPFGVTVEATVAACLLQEKELHRALDRHRTRPGRRTEWYFWNSDTQRLAEMAKAGTRAEELIAAAYEMTGAERQEMGHTEFCCERCGQKFLRNRRDVLAGQTRFCTNLCAARASADMRIARNRAAFAKQIEEALG